MPLYQVTCKERVYIDRTYEIVAADAPSAAEAIRKSQGDAGDFIDEQVQDTYSFEHVLKVHDENGNECEF